MNTIYFTMDDGEGDPTKPNRAYKGDAGWDLYCSRTQIVEPNSLVDVHTDIRVALPEHFYGRIVTRSSTMRVHGLVVSEGIIDNGWRLSEGIRRRIALARGLATGGMLAVIDEPTESLDAEGCAAIHAVLGGLVQRGCTVIVMSHDKNIVKGRHVVLDLDEKPVPVVRQVNPSVQPVDQQPAQTGTDR